MTAKNPKNASANDVEDLPTTNVEPSDAAKVKGGLVENQNLGGMRRRGLTGDWNSDGSDTIA